jgi:hypothetical protein
MIHVPLPCTVPKLVSGKKQGTESRSQDKYRPSITRHMDRVYGAVVWPSNCSR